MHDGQRLVSSEMLDTLHTSHMVCEMTEVNENNTHMGSYGLGWLIEPYRGSRMVSHGGNIDGFTAHVAFIPAEKIGVVVLSNLNGTPLPVFIANYIFDSMLGGEVKDWSGQALGQKREATVASESVTNSKATSSPKEPIVPLSTSWLNLTQDSIPCCSPSHIKMGISLNSMLRSLITKPKRLFLRIQTGM
ncbi:serine hydrolase [Paenibacillus lautus]|nr:serine hydrolase [Paenibacillus lautus]